MRIPWTEEELDLALSFRCFEDMTFPEISKRLVEHGFKERSSDSIRRKVNRTADNYSEDTIDNELGDTTELFILIEKICENPLFLTIVEGVVKDIVNRVLDTSNYYSTDSGSEYCDCMEVECDLSSCADCLKETKE